MITQDPRKVAVIRVGHGAFRLVRLVAVKNPSRSEPHEQAKGTKRSFAASSPTVLPPLPASDIPRSRLSLPQIHARLLLFKQCMGPFMSAPCGMSSSGAGRALLVLRTSIKLNASRQYRDCPCHLLGNMVLPRVVYYSWCCA